MPVSVYNASINQCIITSVYFHRRQVNMGNIHFKTGQYNKAIKYYKMALDQVGPPLDGAFYLK